MLHKLIFEDKMFSTLANKIVEFFTIYSSLGCFQLNLYTTVVEFYVTSELFRV